MNQILEKHDAGAFSEVSIESVILDADLFVRYGSIEKAFTLLHEAIERSPHSIAMREKMREVSATYKNHSEAARQCLALVSLYISREEFDRAYDRLQEAKLFDPRISVASGLEAIRRARRPEFAVKGDRMPAKVRTDCAFAGDISIVSLFDAIQVVENSKITGMMILKSDVHTGNISFNHGKIVDAEVDGFSGESAFRVFVEMKQGVFEFTISTDLFAEKLKISSNTNFLLDILTQLDSEKAEKQGMRNLATEDL